MPELPEVQTTVDGLNKKVLKRTFIDVWSDWEKTVKKPKSFAVFKKELKRKKINKVWRRAKNVIFDLSDGYSLLIHQKMTGHLLHGTWNMKHKTPNSKAKLATGQAWVPAKKGALEEKINLYIHIMFFLDDGLMIALSDLRKFAKVELWKTKELLNSKEFKSLGPEPLEKSFTSENFKKQLKNKKAANGEPRSPRFAGEAGQRRGKIKIVLMSPEIIAGVGNIYANEALWWSKIHPTRDVSQLTEQELKNLYKAIKKVLLLGVRLGGESFADYRKIDGSKGEFDDERKIYQREGEGCFRCKTAIKRIKFGGRSSFFCPRCQNL